MFLILLVWYINLVSELQACLLLADFAYSYPEDSSDPFRTMEIGSAAVEIGGGVLVKAMDSAVKETHRMTLAFGQSSSEAGRDEGTESFLEHLRAVHERLSDTQHHNRREVGEKIFIRAICYPHKIFMIGVVVIRLALLAYMAGAGTIFLITTYSYADLLLNAVALAFVFKLPELFYHMLVRHTEKEELESVEPLEFTSSLPKFEGFMSIIMTKNALALLFFPLLCYVILAWNYFFTIAPVREALQCLCYQTGPRCLTQKFMTNAWWDEHWAEVARKFPTSSAAF